MLKKKVWYCRTGFSPIKGPEGNIYLLHLTLGDDNAVSETMIDELVSKSHGDLDKPQTQE
ncbi:MAG: hypothetical protein ACLR2G_02730 [Phascolarctobacterium faecium]